MLSNRLNRDEVWRECLLPNAWLIPPVDFLYRARDGRIPGRQAKPVQDFANGSEGWMAATCASDAHPATTAARQRNTPHVTDPTGWGVGGNTGYKEKYQ